MASRAHGQQREKRRPSNANTVDAENDLNTLFARLNDVDISVVSLRNKANRLEELFMGLVESKQSNGQAIAG